MRNIVLWFFALALLATPGHYYAAIYAKAMPQESQDQLPDAWKELEPAYKSQWLSDRIAKDIAYATKRGPQEFAQQATRYPFTGVGIQYGSDPKEETKTGGTIALRVTAVYVGSPADLVGLQPGDWMVRVNDTPVCTVSISNEDNTTPERYKAKTQEVEECTKTVQEAFTQAQGTITVAVEREGKTVELYLVKVPIGQRIAEEIAVRLGDWKQDFARTASDLEKLAQRVKAAGNTYKDSEKLNAEIDACFLELQRQRVELEKPSAELSKIERKHIRVLEEPQR